MEMIKYIFQNKPNHIYIKTTWSKGPMSCCPLCPFSGELCYVDFRLMNICPVGFYPPSFLSKIAKYRANWRTVAEGYFLQWEDTV